MDNLEITPIAASDLDALYELVNSAGTHRITTLYQTQEQLATLIKQSVDSFKELLVQKERYFLFVLKDPLSKKIFGCSALAADVNKERPLSLFELRTDASHKSYIQLTTLPFEASEFRTLYIDPAQRGHHYSDKLSLARCKLIEQHPEWFCDYCISEIRGLVDEQGQSPFWQNFISKYFPNQSFNEIDKLRSNEFAAAPIIKQLPKNPIYIKDLPIAAQNSIFQVHPKAQHAFDILTKSGLHMSSYLDILDGGCLLVGETKAIRAS